MIKIACSFERIEFFDTLQLFVPNRRRPIQEDECRDGFEKESQQNTKSRSPWTKGGLGELKAHSKAWTPVVKVAKVMKRTEAAVRQKAKKHWHRPGPSTLRRTQSVCTPGPPFGRQSTRDWFDHVEAQHGAAAVIATLRYRHPDRSNLSD